MLGTLDRTPGSQEDVVSQTEAGGLRRPWVPRVGQGPHHVLVVEQVHHAGRPLAHGHQVGRGLVEPQQAQGCALLHAVHAVPAGRVGWRVLSATPALHPLLLSPLLGRVSSERRQETPRNPLRLPPLPTRPPSLPLQNGLHLSNLTGSQAGQVWLCAFSQSPPAYLSTYWAPGTPVGTVDRVRVLSSSVTSDSLQLCGL